MLMQIIFDYSHNGAAQSGPFPKMMKLFSDMECL
jgi:hypothetical protein